MTEQINNPQQLNLFNEPENQPEPCADCGELIGEGGAGEYCANCLTTCDGCNSKIPTQQVQNGPDRGEYCEDCYNDRFMVCPNCGELIETTDYLDPDSIKNRRYLSEGGCTNCAVKCEHCNKVVSNNDVITSGRDSYCEECFNENFVSCDECGDTVDVENSNYVDSFGSYCESCFADKFFYCDECNEVYPMEEGHYSNNRMFCNDCYDDSDRAVEEYPEHIKDFDSTDYTKKDRFLHQLKKLLPITVKDLKDNHPRLADALRDLIIFSKGKTLTPEVIEQYRGTLNPETFPVSYTTYSGTLGQRSIKKIKNKNDPSVPSKKSQLVINILASQDMLGKMIANPALYDLFDNINTVSKESSHPYIKDQIGWARLEIDPSNNFILVDEIQSDHNNAAYELRTSEGDDIARIKDALKKKYNLDDAGFQKLLAEYAAMLKDFPNIASETVAKFARKNNIKKIYWHTYEGGKSLKHNEPPKSLYTTTPKEHFYAPSTDKPFGLEADFFEREASRAFNMVKLARKLYFKSFKK